MVACFTTAGEAPNGVSTAVFTASICSVAFIDVCRKSQQQNIELICNVAFIDALQSLIGSVSLSCNYVPNHADLSFGVTLRTTAVQSIFIQLISCVTAADEAPNSVSTTVFTASISSATFIDVCGTRKITATKH